MFMENGSQVILMLTFWNPCLVCYYNVHFPQTVWSPLIWLPVSLVVHMLSPNQLFYTTYGLLKCDLVMDLEMWRRTMSSKMSFLQFCFISEDLFIYLKDSFIERQEEIFISWFTPQTLQWPRLAKAKVRSSICVSYMGGPSSWPFSLCCCFARHIRSASKAHTGTTELHAM